MRRPLTQYLLSAELPIPLLFPVDHWFENLNFKPKQYLTTTEADIIAISNICKEIFHITDMVYILGQSVVLPVRDTTINVPIQ